MIFFETPRLIFRRFEQEDLEALAKISADQEVCRYVGDGCPLTLERTREWIDNSRKNVARFGYGTGAVVVKNRGALIGWAGVSRPADGLEEIIYGLDRPYWGMGLGTELLAGILAWARTSLNLNELRATVSSKNSASVAMLLRQGFILVDDCYEGDPTIHLYRVALENN